MVHGITSFQDAGSSLETIDLFKKLADEGKLKVRLWVMVRDSNERLASQLSRYRLIGYGNSFLTVRAIKRSLDGALGSHGAWLLAPYDDLPSSNGLNTATIASVTRTARIALSHDFQLCVHASVTRQLPSGITFFPAQRMTREEALKSYTVSAAYGAFEEDEKGSLEPGKLVDIVVLSKDIMTCPEQEIPQAQVMHTIIGGVLRYSSSP